MNDGSMSTERPDGPAIAPRSRWPLAIASLSLATVVGTAAAMAFTVPVTTVPASSRSWIDAPRIGDSVAPDGATVLAHSTDEDGVALVELRVDGAAVASRRVSASPRVLVSTSFDWRPEGPGSHALEVWARDVHGEWGDPGRLVVVVGEQARPRQTPRATPTRTARPTPRATRRPTPRPTRQPTPKPTRQPTPRPTRRPTPRPTVRPCVPPAPTSLSPTDGTWIDTPAGNPPTFRWGYRTAPRCAPTRFRLVVVDADGATVWDERLAGDARAWRPPRPFANCQIYSWRIRAFGTGGAGSWSATRDLLVSYRC